MSHKDVQQKALTSVPSVDCPAINAAAGDLVFVAQVAFNPTTGWTHQAPTDSAGGNTYTQIGATEWDGANNFGASRWYSILTNGSASLVITAHVSITVSALTGIAWVQNGLGSYNSDTKTATATSTNPASGNSTPAPSGSSIFLGQAHFNSSGTTLTDGSGWNALTNGFTSTMLTNAKQTNNSTLEACYLEWKRASGVTSATWTAASDTWWANVQSFLESAAAVVIKGYTKNYRPAAFKPGSMGR